MYILHDFQCKILHQNTSLKVELGPNKIINMKNFKFSFYFCLQYVLSLAIPLNIFGLSFLKNNTKNAFYGLLQCKVYLIFFTRSKQNIPYPLFPIHRLSLYSLF